MRIVFVTHYASMFGANRSLLHLIRQLAEAHGVVPLVLCPEEGAFPEICRKEGFQVLVIPFNNAAYTIRSLKLLLFPWLYWKTRTEWFPLILGAVQDFKPDLIHSNASVVDVGWQLAERLCLPHIWHLREFGWIDYKLVFPLGKNRTWRRLSEASCAICISEAIANAWRLHLPSNALVLYNGIGKHSVLEQRLAVRKTKLESHSNTDFTFLIIGLLQPSKGQFDALRAFDKLYQENRDVRLVIAGNGRWLYTRMLHMYVRIRRLSKVVIFTGYVEDPAACYVLADAVLMCSRNEAMGRVTAEAMSYGLPVIGFAGGATPELIKEGENGILYRHPGQLVEGMRRLVRMNAVERASMGQAAFRQAVDQFTDERYAAAFYNVAVQLAAVR